MRFFRKILAETKPSILRGISRGNGENGYLNPWPCNYTPPPCQGSPEGQRGGGISLWHSTDGIFYQERTVGFFEGSRVGRPVGRGAWVIGRVGSRVGRKVCGTYCGNGLVGFFDGLFVGRIKTLYNTMLIDLLSYHFSSKKPFIGKTWNPKLKASCWTQLHVIWSIAVQAERKTAAERVLEPPVASLRGSHGLSNRRWNNPPDCRTPDFHRSSPAVR